MVQTTVTNNKLDLTETAEEYWGLENRNLRYSLNVCAEQMNGADVANNANHFSYKLEAVVRKTLSRYYATLKKREGISPLKTPLARNSDHPQIEELKTAIKN